jgi:hypothetical protein
VFETTLKVHAAVPASHQPALRPTRGSGFGLVAPTTMFGVGAELADADDDDDDAHPAATSDPAAMDRRESCLTGDRGLGTGDWDSARTSGR